MHNYISVVFDSEKSATDALHALWKLDKNGDITVHGTAVIKRDALGYIQVASKETHPGWRTAVGIGIGALLGALAGPAGAALGIAGASSIVIGSAAGIGAAAGGLAGVTVDGVKSAEHDQAGTAASFTLDPGQSALIAEVSEDGPGAVNAAMTRHGGIVFRRATSQVRSDAFSDDYYTNYLYPYDYDPYFYPYDRYDR
jgi:uncharacterized membrane protein